MDLASLCVEVNARRTAPWTMPAAIRPRCTALVEAGLTTTADVAAALCDRRSAFSAVDWDEDGLRALAQVPLHRVFVYGSLLTGLHNSGRLAGARLLGTATTSDNFALRSAGAYPYAVDGADAPGLSTTPLAGELYVCSTDQLGRLDALEDHPSYYKRRCVRLRGDDAEAWMYVLRDADALANVRARPDAFADAAGDWCAFLERNS